MGTEHGKIGVTQRAGLLHGKSRGRSSRLKSYGEKYHFRFRMAPGESNRLQR